MELTNERKWKKPTYSIGVLSVNNRRFSETIEDRDRGLTSTMSVEEIKKIKIYGETAIPTGRYRVVLSVSQKFINKVWSKKYDGLVPEILGVKGFSGIRIHPANTAEQLLGCLAPGENKAVGKVLYSQKTYYALMDEYLMPAHKAGEEIYITIR